VILGGIALGFVLGLLAGGKIGNLVSVRLRWPAVLLLAVILRVLTEAALVRGSEVAESLRLVLFAATYGMLLAALFLNRRHPGMAIAFVGVLLNGCAILANGGYMPVWAPALEAAGFGIRDVEPALQVVLPPPIDASFLLHAGVFGDVIPIPIPVIRNVISIGDILISAGLAFFLFATLVRSPEEFASEIGARSARLVGLAGTSRIAPLSGRPRRPVAAETGIAASLVDASRLERPAVLGGSGLGLVSPALAPLESPVTSASAEVTLPVPRILVPGAPEIAERVRHHPYVRLALNGSFSALWFGQLVSLFGDRVHQIALAFLVLGVTNSPLAVGLVFVAATLPNLLFSPLAGTFVDRWDQKEVMVVSDLLRAAIVLLIPIVAVVSVYLIYPLVFLLTSISIFFRPARVAVLPRIVDDDELMTGNSALWVGETLADVVGYPLAGLFVAFVGTALPLAFWIDGASYLASAALISTMAVPALAPRQRDRPPGLALAEVSREMSEGWSFLRSEVTLLANTVQGAVGQFSNGVLIALAPVYAQTVLAGSSADPATAYAFLETGIGVGGLVGGFAVGLVGARFAKGRLVIVGYALWGACMIGISAVASLPLAFGLMVGAGVANMVYVIPSQTMFQERTPPHLIGRVVGFRFSIVFGALTLAMAVAGALGEVMQAGEVIGVFGLVTLAAGLAGLLVPAVRDA
jgi:MFS family permease